MTKREAAIVNVYTGFICGKSSEVHKYMEEIIGRKLSIEEACGQDIMDEVQQRAKEDFANLIIE